jgi:hypothetical protein
MSHPDPGRTYEDDALAHLSDEEIERLFELYVQECEQRGVKADLSQFTVWLEDNDYGRS